MFPQEEQEKMYIVLLFKRQDNKLESNISQFGKEEEGNNHFQPPRQNKINQQKKKEQKNVVFFCVEECNCRIDKKAKYCKTSTSIKLEHSTK
ncbi:hypothetical protein RFI_05410 [Reticulomyxa filosa]|uniref:Uncharacterized protein n=1 Tax=Reticulomyxa filosa TaxID=46433 RepID=X6NZH0_RETFI|nr:hypothetical protein RFI_05410 [Reticulomyxa filosa]|eukprot:ETO31710.1 hypothetical protein RFI_05410 [Reticulomyxa filosa]